MPTWSKRAMQDMADLINRDKETSDAVATLRHLVNQWADTVHGRGTRTFSGNGHRRGVEVTVENGEVLSVEHD